MSLSPLDSHLYAPLFAVPEITAVFTDHTHIQQMLLVEGALAEVQGRLGIIPAAAAAEIRTAVAELTIDWPQLQAGLEQAGVPVIALVAQLRRQVGGEAANYVHWGATTQDIVDTALVLQLRAALAVLEPLLGKVIALLAELADAHRHTVMAGRTHSQHALPITFGFKAAGWLAPLLRHRQRLAQLKPRLLVVQFGGAVGTLAALGERGTAVLQALADELNLHVPLLPWHTQRDSLAEFAGWLSLVSGNLAKMAQDIILLAQSEVGELRESGDPSRGGSSTMPQKSNPITSELIIAAARTNASLLGNMHQALVQEQERATHGWQMEWLTLPQMVRLTAVCLQKAATILPTLVVNREQMAANVAASLGLMLAETLTFALAPDHMSRAEAKELVAGACKTAVAQNRHLFDIVREQTHAPLDWDSLRQEANYLGSASAFIDQVLRHVAG